MASGRSSRRSILIVAGVAVVMAAGGFLAARLVISPEDAASRTAAPVAGPITVAVESKKLDADIVTRGDIGFSGSVQVKLESGGTTNGASIVTGRVPEVGSVVENGTVLLEVTGRPVLAMSGDLPTYRSLAAGSTGPDVEQVEATLAGLGFDPGPQDKAYDAATGAAVAALYQKLGYPAPQPAVEVTAALTAAQAAANAADQGVVDAHKALDAAQAGPTQSARLTLQSAIDAAQAGYDAARRTSSAPDQAAVDRASKVLDTASAQFSALTEALAVATEPAVVVDLSAQLELARQTVAGAQAALDKASQGGPPDASAVAAAKAQLDIAKAQRDEALKVDTTTQQAALATAQASAAEAQTQLGAARAAATTPLPAQEVVWLAGMPRRVDEVRVARGSTVDGAVLSVSGADLAVRASVSAEEATLISVGLTAQLAIPGGAAIPAVVTEVGAAATPADKPQDGANAGAGGGGSGSGGKAASGSTVVLQPQNVTNEQAQVLRGANVKVTIPVASTSGAVLVVPVAGLFSDADGTPRVEVLAGDGTTRFQPVKIGLSTGGEVEVSPLDAGGAALQPSAASLTAGSLVVVGR